MEYQLVGEDKLFVYVILLIIFIVTAGILGYTIGYLHAKSKYIQGWPRR